MSRRATLAELRQTVLAELDHHWQTPTEIGARLGLNHGIDHYRLALTLERLANDGLAELKTPGATVRRFRRSMTQGGMGVVEHAHGSVIPRLPRGEKNWHGPGAHK